MIDWNASSVVEGSAKNKDRVFVKCEKCGGLREQLFIVAKRKNTHICMSCVKLKSKHRRGELVEYTCVGCGLKQVQQYRSDRFDDWRCHHCAMVKGHEDGKFVVIHNVPSEAGRKKIGELAKSRWEDPEYRKKWKASRDKTKDKRSVSSKRVWSDEERLARLSKSIKLVWDRPEYRTLKTKQSQELWEDRNYRRKQISGYTSDIRNRISEFSKQYWRDNYDKMVSIIKRNLTRPEVLAKLSEASKKVWLDEIYQLKQSIKSKKLWENEEYRERGERILAEIRTRMPFISKPQKKLYDLLHKMGVEFVVEGSDTQFGPFIFDCLVPNLNLLIEMQGDYWHSFAKNMANDKRKFEYINEYFPEFKIMYIWEHELEDGSAIGRLESIFGSDKKPVDFDFRDVTVRLLSFDECKRFMDSYHYIGGCRGGVAVGGFLGEKLIGAVMFTSPIRQGVASGLGVSGDSLLELSRFCIHPSFHKKNFASWLLSKSFRFIDVDVVVSYCDCTVGHVGTIYKASGFNLHHVVKPDYWYVTPDNWVLHKRTVYGRAKRDGLRERDFAEKFGYLKKFGGPKLCFTKELKGRRGVI